MILNLIIKEMLSDLYTPVSLFLKLRDKFANVVMLESSEYASKEGSYSFIAFDELASIEVKNHQVKKFDLHNNGTTYPLTKNIVQELNDFILEINHKGLQSDFNGLFGFTAFESIKYFEENSYNKKESAYDIPDLKYSLYRYIIVFDHFKNKLIILENIPDNNESKMDDIINLIQKQDHQTFGYTFKDNEEQNMSDDQFMEIVNECKQHCKRGDVFQIVPSRRYSYSFSGDEFNVYRNLRSINPSPYLFYFDYSSYKMFGSSPEAQIIIKNGEAEVHPIAGTIKRSLDYSKDAENTEKLLNDPKENAEHIMLVDLARNDLSKNTSKVHVASYKEVQYFSHVIHLVSKVKGTINEGQSAYQIFADTFPQGTLSGAPKIKALQIIENLEPNHRGHYGGAIGMIGFNNELNHAIVIRSVLSIDNKLHLQAGAGVVIDSLAAMELKEVNNKLGALKSALNVEI
jgi:anthranilate synthase component I